MLEIADFNKNQSLIINDMMKQRSDREVELQLKDRELKLNLHSTTLTNYPVVFEQMKKQTLSC